MRLRRVAFRPFPRRECKVYNALVDTDGLLPLLASSLSTTIPPPALLRAPASAPCACVDQPNGHRSTSSPIWFSAVPPPGPSTQLHEPPPPPIVLPSIPRQQMSLPTFNGKRHLTKRGTLNPPPVSADSTLLREEREADGMRRCLIQADLRVERLTAIRSVFTTHRT